jgi:hypothetical protein
MEFGFICAIDLPKYRIKNDDSASVSGSLSLSGAALLTTSLVSNTRAVSDGFRVS